MDLDFLFISRTGDWSPQDGWERLQPGPGASVRGTHASKIREAWGSLYYHGAESNRRSASRPGLRSPLSALRPMRHL
jgi:hypothetical protein